MKKKLFIKIIFFCLCPIAFTQTQSAGLQSLDGLRTAEEGFAAEEFRRGVQTYYRNSYNDAVNQFEKALSYMPYDNLILDWLGKAYYHSGLEGSALDRWKTASENGYGGLLLQNKIEIVGERQVRPERYDYNSRFTEAGVFQGTLNDVQIFRGPVSILPNNDGTFWVLAYGSNEMVLMNVNGAAINRITGPLNGFDRPVDMIKLDGGNILISESSGDRLALFNEKGRFIKYYGKKGRGTGELIGPQYIAEDERHNVYVSDYGNRRISVFDKDGNGIFTFGTKTPDFEGLKGPTGIVAIGERIFVADDISGCIHEFDLSGNYRRKLVPDKTFRHPESMKVWNGYLVICDSNKVFSVDADSGAIYENAKTGNAPARLTSAVPDVNGNILVTDIRTNEIYIMTRMQELIGGFFVQIEDVNSEKFPEVVVGIKVENRSRHPIVGLKENNFYITEDKRPVPNLRFLGAKSSETDADITLIIDRTSQASSQSARIDTAVREITTSFSKNSSLKIISAGNVPALEYTGSPAGAKRFSSANLKTQYSDTVPLDLALRLACNELIKTRRKSAIILVSCGKVTQSAFDRYSLNDLTSYMNNNSIACLSVLVTENAADEEISYIVNNTSGGEYYMFRPAGLSGIFKDIIDIPAGKYVFSFTSALSTNMGEKYLPLEVEAYLLNRSGRDESGYFAPLK
ncbi:MAG: hypothetical protein ACTTJ1_04610 [Treponema sp.]